MIPLRLFLGLVTVALAVSSAGAAGFQYAAAPDPDGQPLELAIWYPSDGKVSPQPIGLSTQDVAFYGAVQGKALPLIVISHGTGGSPAGHADTALALAEAGFIGRPDPATATRTRRTASRSATSSTGHGISAASSISC